MKRGTKILLAALAGIAAVYGVWFFFFRTPGAVTPAKGKTLNGGGGGGGGGVAMTGKAPAVGAAQAAAAPSTSGAGGGGSSMGGSMGATNVVPLVEAVVTGLVAAGKAIFGGVASLFTSKNGVPDIGGQGEAGAMGTAGQAAPEPSSSNSAVGTDWMTFDQMTSSDSTSSGDESTSSNFSGGESSTFSGGGTSDFGGASGPDLGAFELTQGGFEGGGDFGGGDFGD